MKRLLFLPLLLLCGAGAAQSGLRPRLGIERQPDHCLDFYLYYEDASPYFGTATVLIDFSLIENCTEQPGIRRCEVPWGGDLERVRVLSLRPSDRARPIRCEYLYRTFYGRINPPADTAFVYRMPSAEGHAVRVLRRPALRDAKGQTAPAGLLFEMPYGDTVYAMRRGRIVRIEDERAQDEPCARGMAPIQSRRIAVEHPDGSMCCYRFLGGGRILAREGDDVLPGTPLGTVGGHPEVRCALTVACYRFTLDADTGDVRTCNPVREGFVPRFATAEGVVVPEHGASYTPVMNDALLLRELSKRERRRLHGAK